ncbi:MAG: HipA N-terminal domain-containing protein, partial [Deltaproteobacteria bacterium]|nr:HipA N-terminal domain-containing protein [Deltaproteobacteria bacterium]
MTRGPVDTLQVYWDEDPEPIGELLRRPDGSNGFRYFAGTSAERRVSHSLPVDGGRAEHPITFFDNLLPDGIQRERLARRLGISDTSTFAMLEAIGGDCAGALSIFRGP